jgi:hypothetical protein
MAYRTAETSMVFFELEAGQFKKSRVGSANGNRTHISALKGAIEMHLLAVFMQKVLDIAPQLHP